MAATSYIREDTPPSAIISDGLVTIPLFAVTALSLNESYHLPPIGPSGQRTAVATHDDTVSLSGLLLGPTRYDLKFALETLSESSKRGTALEGITHGAVSGLIVVTALTVRVDMQVQSLAFSVSAARRDAIDVSISLVHMPRPGALTKVLEVVNLGVRGLADIGGK